MDRGGETVAFFYRSFGLVLMVVLLGAVARAQDDDSATPTPRRSSATGKTVSKRQKIDLAQAQIATAQQTLDDAKKNGAMSQAEIDAMQQRVDQAREALDSVDTNLRMLRRSVQDVEKTLLFSQPVDSDIAKAQTALSKAKNDLDREADRVIHSPECQKRIKRVQDVVDADQLAAFIRKDALENDVKYQKALMEYQYARKDFGRLKKELLSENPEWSVAADALRDAEEKARKARQLWAGLSR
jgi:hypothetical protein